MKLRVLALLLALAIIPGAAFADRPSPEDGPLMTRATGSTTPLLKRSFDELDSDRDGRLSPAETAQVSLLDSFWELDRNRDGFLNRQEHDYHPN
ncbi:EF-hand domain-containing protein [Billgrantia diversa]|uniref:EF-hand domain-containing protein n=1 Tax=Halomonas sp. MCCC 1A13316 TaxID=2733487 RepID=UPI0018A58461|nr:EF-hand domain-containing protein [Halomonas sp. MCCC 1A13316]QOR39980.1 EF-hand domain-containing protein [Halomonas sp. MCCC 1A13316]